MSQVFKKGPVKPEMNITPLIDVVFLLIIFFMLVNKIISENNVEIVAPELTKPLTRDLGEVKKIIVNVDPGQFKRKERLDGNPLLYSGEAVGVQVGTTKIPLEQMDRVTKLLVEAKNNNPEVEVLLRADAATYYEFVQQVLAAITDAKIAKVNLVAYTEEFTNKKQGGGTGG